MYIARIIIVLYVRTYVRACIYIYIYIYIYSVMCIWAYACLHSYKSVFVCIPVLLYIHHMFASVTRLSHNGGAVRGVHWSVRNRWLLDAVHRTNHSRSYDYPHRIVVVHHHCGHVRQTLVDCSHVSTTNRYLECSFPTICFI